eukprot:14443769-Alexandrium_andersonii.AAC.1
MVLPFPTEATLPSPSEAFDLKKPRLAHPCCVPESPTDDAAAASYASDAIAALFNDSMFSYVECSDDTSI